AEELAKQLDAIIDGKPAPNLPDWLKKSAEAYAEKQLARDELASKDQATREGLAIFFRLAAQHFRRLLESTDDPSVPERAASAIDAIARAENYLDSNVNVALTLLQLALSLDRAFATQEA